MDATGVRVRLKDKGLAGWQRSKGCRRRSGDCARVLPLPQEQFTSELRAMHEANAELRVFIRGDESARLGLAITVLDEVRRLGITHVAFGTRPKP